MVPPKLPHTLKSALLVLTVTSGGSPGSPGLLVCSELTSFKELEDFKVLRVSRPHCYNLSQKDLEQIPPQPLLFPASWHFLVSPLASGLTDPLAFCSTCNFIYLTRFIYDV